MAMELDRAVWNQVRAYPGVSVLEGFRLRPGLTVDLEVKRFQVTRPDTQFVVHVPGATSVGRAVRLVAAVAIYAVVALALLVFGAFGSANPSALPLGAGSAFDLAGPTVTQRALLGFFFAIRPAVTVIVIMMTGVSFMYVTAARLTAISPGAVQSIVTGFASV